MCRFAFSLLLALCTLAPAVSVSQDVVRTGSADEAEVEFRLGNQAFLAGRFDAALGHYFASHRLVPNRNVIFNIAKCYENLRLYVEAYRYYQLYLETAADDEQESIRKAMQDLERRVGLLVIESDPAGATIYLDRLDLGSFGTTPMEVPVRPGEYRIILDHPGYEIREFETLTIEAGQRIEQATSLVRREGVLALSGAPDHVSVTVLPSGSPQSFQLPGEFHLPVGAQTLRIESTGYEALELPVEILEREVVRAQVALTRQTGTLVVTASELNSAVFLNGQLVGFTPIVIPNVDVGSHTLSINQEGFEAFVSQLDVEADTRQEVSATLSAASEVAAASRVAESLRDAPASVSLISSREIDAFAYSGTADAIAGVRGFFYTNDMSYRLVGVRGYGPFGQFGNRTLVQLDGHTINDSWVEASYNQFEVLSDLYGLDRIEVVRGPNSLLYGSGAFQGVVNLVSPELDDPYRPSRVGTSAVSEGVLRAYAHVRHPFEDVKGGIQLSAGVVGGQGRDFFSPARLDSVDYPTGIAQNMGDFNTVTTRANVQVGDFRLYSYWNEFDQQIPTGAYEVIFADPRARSNERRGYVGMRHDHTWREVVDVQTRVYYDYYRFRGAYPYPEDDGGLLQDNFDGHWGGVDTRLTFRPFQGSRLSVGAELVRHFIHDARSVDLEETILDSSNPFWKTSTHAMLRQDFHERFGLLVGARYDLWLFDTLPGSDGERAARQIGNINPRLVLMGRPTETGTLKLMTGRGFRAPSVYELTYNDGGITQIASPDLEPETIYSGELEYTQELGDSFELVGAIFLNHIDTRIEQDGGGVEDDPLQFVNRHDPLWTGGAEVELRRPFLRGWMVSAHYAWQRTRIGDISTLWTSSPPIPNSPTH
ncbi:MAG: TonB-dependent receptor domain-containing protein, partial [Bradymonadaceae bacterium]